MVAWVGFRQVPIAYDRAERHAGESKYPLSKMIRFALDAVTGFSTAPLRWPAISACGWSPPRSCCSAISPSASSPARDPGLDVIDAGRRRARRGADVRARDDRRISRPALYEAKHRPLYIVAEIAGHAGGSPSLGHVAHEAETIATSDTPGGNGSRPIA
jgi:hypothetical protein